MGHSEQVGLNQAAIIMLAGIFYGARYGGSTTSILVRMPGEAASVITCPDIFMFVPIFVDDYLLGYAVLVGHYNDVGGRVPGSSAADSTEVYQEDLRIPVLELYERGRANETLLELICINVRIPDVVLGDPQAQLAACRIGERGVSELARRLRPLLRDQAIRHVTAGAGGYGDLLLRDPARVLDDVRNGKVSVQAAERDYGVRVSGPPWCVEEPATRELRTARASSPDTAPVSRR